METLPTKEITRENKTMSTNLKRNSFYNSFERLLTNASNLCKYPKKIVVKLQPIRVQELNKQNILKYKVII